jgi:ketosteroid isomerase-like protein
MAMSGSTSHSSKENDPVGIAKQAYEAFAAGDRPAMERLLSADFRFTSPLDNRIDRSTYFRRCWPNSGTITSFRFACTAREGDHVYVTYEGTTAAGKGFRNTEMLLIREGKLVEVEVYFGWSLPHEAPEGSFKAPE